MPNYIYKYITSGASFAFGKKSLEGSISFDVVFELVFHELLTHISGMVFQIYSKYFIYVIVNFIAHKS